MKRFYFICLLCFGILLLASLIAACITKYTSGSPTVTSTEAVSGWKYEDGSAAKLDDLTLNGDAFEVTRRLPESMDPGTELCLISTNVDFEVFLDDRQIYSYTPVIRTLYGKTYGNDIHAIELSGAEPDSVLRIRGKGLDTSMFVGFREASLDSGDAFYRKTIRKELPKFLISFLIFALGILITLLGIFFSKDHELQLETIALGLLAITLSLWTATGTYVIQIITGNPGMVRLVNYLSLMVLPASGITLVACLTGRPKSRLVLPIHLIVIMNLIMYMIGIFILKKDFHAFLFITHFSLILAVVFAIQMLIGSLRRKPEQGESRDYTTLIAFGILVLTGLVDLVLYYFSDSADMARFSRVGLLIFVTILAGHELNRFIVISEKSHEADVMERLAHVDGLTGLKNRTSLNEHEFALKHESEGVAVLTVFDINYLKKVNDTYGHKAGDDFIRHGASIIDKSFGETGWIFRTGGDEFFAILFSPDPKRESELLLAFEKGEKLMKEQIQKHNDSNLSPVPLQIAYGMSVYHCRDKNLEEQEQLADSRMYEHKKQLKQGC